MAEGLFAAFNKTFDVDPNVMDEQQTETMVRYGQFYKQFSGKYSKADKSIARPLVNGRDARSEKVVNAYAISGVDIPEELAVELDELDNIAQMSNQLAAMDAKTRNTMAARGHDGFNPSALAQKENQILSRITDMTRDVMTEEDRIDLAIKKANLQSKVATQRKELASIQAKEKAEKIATMLDGVSTDELLDLESNSTFPPGVSRTEFLNYMADRLDDEKKLIDRRNLDPENAGLFDLFGSKGGKGKTAKSGSGRSSSVLGTKIGSDARITALASSFDMDDLNKLMTGVNDRIIDEKRSNAGGDDPNNPVTFNELVEIPGFGRVTRGEVQAAILERRELEDKFEEPEDEIRMVNNANYRLSTTVAQFQNKGTIIGYPFKYGNLGSEQHRDMVVEATGLLKQGDYKAANEVIDNLKKLNDDILSNYIERTSLSDEEKRFKFNLMDTSTVSTPYDLAYTIANNDPVRDEENVRNSPLYREVFFNTEVWKSQFEGGDGNRNNSSIGSKKKGEGLTGSDLVSNLLSSSNKDKRSEVEKQRAEHMLTMPRNLVASAWIKEFDNIILTEATANVFNEAIDSRMKMLETISDPNQGAQLERELTAYRKLQRILFGDNPSAKKLSSQKVNGLINYNGNFKYRDDKNNEVVYTDNNGEPITNVEVNAPILFQTLRNMDTELQEVGIDKPLLDQLTTSIQSNKEYFMDLARPRNITEMSYFAMMSPHALQFGLAPEIINNQLDQQVTFLTDRITERMRYTQDDQSVVNYGAINHEKQRELVNERTNELIKQSGLDPQDPRAGALRVKAYGELNKADKDSEQRNLNDGFTFLESDLGLDK